MVEDACDCALLGIEGEAASFAVCHDFFKLVEKTDWACGESGDVVSIGERAGRERVGVCVHGRRYAIRGVRSEGRGVSVAIDSEPACERFNVQKTDEGGEGVALYGASADLDRASAQARCFVECDCGGCFMIDTLNGGNGIRWEAEISKDAE